MPYQEEERSPVELHREVIAEHRRREDLLIAYGADLERENESINLQHRDEMDRSNALEEQRNQARAERDELQRQLDALNDEGVVERLRTGEELASWEESLNARHSGLDDREDAVAIREKESDVRKLRDRKRKASEELKTTRRELNQTKGQLRELKADHATLKTKHESLEATMRRRIEGSGVNTQLLQGMLAAREALFSLQKRGIELNESELVNLERSNQCMVQLIPENNPVQTIHVNSLPEL